MFGQSKFWAPTSNEGGATVAVIFTVARLVRSGVGASAWAQSAVVATASLAIVLVWLSRRRALKLRVQPGEPQKVSCRCAKTVPFAMGS